MPGNQIAVGNPYPVAPAEIRRRGYHVSAGDILIEPLRQSFEAHTLIKREDVPDSTQTIIRASRFTDNGACLGAVGMVLRHHGQLN